MARAAWAATRKTSSTEKMMETLMDTHSWASYVQGRNHRCSKSTLAITMRMRHTSTGVLFTKLRAVLAFCAAVMRSSSSWALRRTASAAAFFRASSRAAHVFARSSCRCAATISKTWARYRASATPRIWYCRAAQAKNRRCKACQSPDVSSARNSGKCTTATSLRSWKLLGSPGRR